jgi:hypothetical protein
MATSPTQGPVIQVRAQPDVYTILMLLAIVALLTAIIICGWKLTTPLADGGYGLEIGQLFKPMSEMPR